MGTKRKYLNKIFKEGIKPIVPNVPLKPKGVYLSEEKFEWMHFATNNSTEAGAILTINVENLDLWKRLTIVEKLGKDTLAIEWICDKAIKPDRITEVEVSTDRMPCKFKRMKIK